MNWLAQLGENRQFVAFFAHFGVAALICEHTPWWMMTVIVGGAAVKEFYFDAHYETDPPQTFWDNAEDWAGWTLGAYIGHLLHY